ACESGDDRFLMFAGARDEMVPAGPRATGSSSVVVVLVQPMGFSVRSVGRLRKRRVVVVGRYAFADRVSESNGREDRQASCAWRRVRAGSRSGYASLRGRSDGELPVSG